MRFCARRLQLLTGIDGELVQRAATADVVALVLGERASVPVANLPAETVLAVGPRVNDVVVTTTRGIVTPPIREGERRVAVGSSQAGKGPAGARHMGMER